MRLIRDSNLTDNNLAEAYYKGTFSEKNINKAQKWCAYAAKKRNKKASALMEEITK